MFFLFKGVMYVGPQVNNDLGKPGAIMMIGGKAWFYQLHNLAIIF